MISSNSKLDLKLGYMVIRNENIRKVHLSEISVLIIESTAVSMTAMLLCELARRKIRVVFCDEAHNPYGELQPYHGSHDSASKIRSQIGWTEHAKNAIWAEIVRMKILKQSEVLKGVDTERARMLDKFADQVEPGDATNREGHAAKVYFNTLFGATFSRRDDNPTNAMLNYGYAIMLSAVNREIAALGYSSEIGIFHNNTFNHYNLGSDLVEPLRPVVDSMVLNMPKEMSTETKHTLAKVLTEPAVIGGRRYHLDNAIPIYVKSVIDSIEADDISLIRFCNYERTCHETDCVLRSPCDNH